MNTHPLGQQAFFNSLLVETTNKHLEGNSVFLPLCPNQSLELKLSYCSPAWRHRYTGEIILHQAEQQQIIDFSQALDLVLEQLYPEIDEQRKQNFRQRICGSQQSIIEAEAALAARSEDSTEQFIHAEQSLTAGHSMHPAAKSCEPLNAQQQRQYLPEHAGQFAIEWFAVHQQHFVGQCSLGQPEQDSTGTAQTELQRVQQQLLAFFQASFAQQPELVAQAQLGQEWWPLPMHPLQAQAWRNSDSATQLSAVVKDLQLNSTGWTATSSTRAIYHPQLPWMLKVSLPVKLTNSLRLLSSTEAERGIQFSRLLQTRSGQELQQRLPSTCFMEEPLWAAIADQHGNVLDLSLSCLRQNPFYQASDEAQTLAPANYYLLASANQTSLAQPSAQTCRWIRGYAEQQNLSQQNAALVWFSAFMDQVIAPLCIARSDYGIVLLAHQQNIVLQIENNLPAGMAYRDCQGIGLTDLALKRFKEEFNQQPPAYFMPAQQLNPFHAYYLIGNTLLNTIAAIGAEGLISEQQLWSLCCDKLSALRAARPKDSSFYDYVLDSPTLHWKRNFYCFLADHNEATLSDPSRIYCDIANPLQLSAAQPQSHKTLAGGRQLCFTDEQTSAGRLEFSVREYGQTIAQGKALLHQRQCHLDLRLVSDAPHSDDLVWWSAAEHAFYQLKASHLQADYFPEAASAHLEASSQGETGPCLSLHQFLQIAPLWREPQAELPPTQHLTAANGIEHPRRPNKPTGQVFTRYYYHLKRQLSFRVIDQQRDLNSFHHWHNHPMIAPVWELAGSLDQHASYLEQMRSDPHQYAVIGEFDGVPFGYFEVYWTPEDRLGPHYAYQNYDRGVHILVGNFDFRGGVYFDTWGCAIIQYCFLDDPRTQRVMGEPRADNHRVVKITERLGLEKQFEFDFPHKRAALLQCERERFFNQFVI
ncbi:GNAT family N-acetyltransferase [Agarivorans sp. Z349TD_8]|uniref:GNAT family N-acetyltransferase n=1 Tax=Agarivorans sp. Z349TD_8 TaxID=3421434 RepID=UPI003D7CFE49